MMLVDLVKYKNMLDTLSIQHGQIELQTEMDAVLHSVSTGPATLYSAELQQISTEINTALAKYSQCFDQYKDSVQQLIEQQEVEYFQRSLGHYEGFCNDSVDVIKGRPINVDPVTSIIVQERLRQYVGAQHPAMVIRPIHAQHVETLVACNPMYFVDTDVELLNLTESWFTPEYQRRLRRYVIKETAPEPMFSNLPQGQFGLIYAFHFFEYRSWPALDRFISECFDLLRPGGGLVFTYNNCDLWTRVGKTDHCSGTYVPGRVLRKRAQELGYEIAYEFNDESDTSWIELVRPGVWSSIRGTQTLAQILQRPPEENANKLDKPPDSVYNEVNILLNVAQRLGIDLKQCVTKGQYSTKKLRRAIEQHIYPQILTEQVVRELFNQRNET